MYEITCEMCGKLAFHPSRVTAESRADRHTRDVGHTCDVQTMRTG